MLQTLNLIGIPVLAEELFSNRHHHNCKSEPSSPP